MPDSTFEFLFRDALSAMDDGDEDRFMRILDEHPELATQRLHSTGTWLTDQIGQALNTFLKDPYLLWFVSEDPVRKGTLPPNICTLASVIIQKAKAQKSPTLQEQLDYAIRLVAWSGVAKKSGVQLDLLDVLIDAGGSTERVSNDALVNGHFEAAEHLIARGAKLTLPTALCLGKWKEADRLATAANDDKKQFSLVLCALNGKAQGVARALDYGAAPSKPSEHLYSHGTPLHHAVSSGSMETVKLLVEAGAELKVKDTIHHGTPLGWAEYGKLDEIVAYLKTRGAV
jgi:hypothetical protein